jgi:DNA-binding LytR/AlgR family response regulator
MIQAIAIDDEPPALRIIENFCSRIDFIQLKKTFTRPTEALEYLKQNDIDLIFLDIQMPSMTGIDVCRNLKSETMVIFTTAYSEFAVEGFNLNAVDYLLKPYTFDRFLQAAQKAQKAYNSTNEPEKENRQLLIKADYSLIKVDTSDILFIEGLDDYLKIHLNNRKPIVARMTMKGILESLPESFIRVHRSFIVSLNKIQSVRNKTIYLEPSAEIPIGNSFEEHFLSVFKGKH